MSKFNKDCTALHTGHGHHPSPQIEPSEVSTNINIYTSEDFVNKWPRFLQISFMIFPSVVNQQPQDFYQIEEALDEKLLMKEIPIARQQLTPQVAVNRPFLPPTPSLIAAKAQKREEPIENTPRETPSKTTLETFTSSSPQKTVIPKTMEAFHQYIQDPHPTTDRIRLTPQSEIDLQAYKHELDQFMPQQMFSVF